MSNAVLKNHLRAPARALAVLLTGMVLAAQALTLGDVQGDAVIGKPLDLGIQIQAAPGETLSAACVSADIHYAEAQQKSPQITVRGNTLRLQLSDVVTEPVVTVEVRTFCGASQLRRYVLLADLPPTFSATVVPPSTQAVAMAPSGALVMPQRAVTSTAKSSAVRAKVSPASKTKKAAKKQKAKSLKAKVTRDRKKTIAQPARSMLKLDPMEILSDRMDTLDATMLFAPTEDALMQSRQIASLQADLKSMQALAVKNDNTLLELRSQLDQAKTQQIPMALVYGLIALVMLCLAGLAWLWHGQRKLNSASHAWWQHPTDSELPAFLQSKEASPLSGFGQPSPTAIHPAANGTAKTSIPAQVDLPIGVAPYKMNPDWVQDVRQQADFFVSIGQSPRAIQILSQQIATSDIPNPLMCLDLLELYRSSGMTTEFHRLRETCHQHFNVQLPEMANFHQDGRDLAAYPDALATLTRLWPGAPAQAFMDSCILRAANTAGRGAFDLAAFRDLLTLHAVAEELALPVKSSKKEASGSGFFSQPTTNSADRPSPDQAIGKDATPSNSLDLDFNLFKDPP